MVSLETFGERSADEPDVSLHGPLLPLCVTLEHVVDLAVGHELALLEPEASRARLADLVDVVGDHHHRARLLADLVDPCEAPGAKVLVADGERLVDQQHIRNAKRGDRERQPRSHAGGVGVHRASHRFAEARELANAIELRLDLLAGHAHREAARA